VSAVRTVARPMLPLPPMANTFMLFPLDAMTRLLPSRLPVEGSDLAHPFVPQSCRGDVGNPCGYAKFEAVALLVLHTHGHTASSIQATDDCEGVGRALDVVIPLQVSVCNAPWLAATVVVVHMGELAGILAEVQLALGIDVACCGPDCGGDRPYAMQFVAYVFL